ncbi:RING-H2 finger protein ATL72 [Vitis vinifera]|uniref:RING-type E3 ubiquitin transferase n=1 Tax=Vitis vinifera TaxID=29760 RepID=A0A438GWZ4_VITVI|nr:RING-H2 finger protein ATL72 [Vitis vinifera]
MEQFLASQPIPQPPSSLPPPPSPPPHPPTTDVGLIFGTDIEIGDMNLNHGGHHPHSHDSPPTTYDILQRSIEQKLMEMAPSFVYGGEGGGVKCSTSECVICWEDFEDGEICRVLPACNHVFHKACVGLWLMEKRVCPLCRVCVDI